MSVVASALALACTKEEVKPQAGPPATVSAPFVPSASVPRVAPSASVTPSATTSAEIRDAAPPAPPGPPPVFTDDPRTKGWTAYEAPDRLYAARFPKPPKADRKEGVPTFVTARYETAKFPVGDLYLVTGMQARTQDPPPPEFADQLLDMVQKRGFQAFDVDATSPKPIKDPFGNPGRDVIVTHTPSKRAGVGRVILNMKDGMFLITLAFGPEAAPFMASSHLLK